MPQWSHSWSWKASLWTTVPQPTTQFDRAALNGTNPPRPHSCEPACPEQPSGVIHVAPPDGKESIQPQNKTRQPLRPTAARGRGAQRRGTVPHDAEGCLRRAGALQSLFQTGAERDRKRRQRLPDHAPRRGRPRRRGRGAGAACARDGRHPQTRDRGRRRQAAAVVAGARPLAVAVPVSLARAAAGPLAVSGPAPRPAAPRRRRPAGAVPISAPGRRRAARPARALSRAGTAPAVSVAVARAPRSTTVLQLTKNTNYLCERH